VIITTPLLSTLKIGGTNLKILMKGDDFCIARFVWEGKPLL
jgi:hypothetical protein